MVRFLLMKLVDHVRRNRRKPRRFDVTSLAGCRVQGLYAEQAHHTRPSVSVYLPAVALRLPAASFARCLGAEALIDP